MEIVVEIHSACPIILDVLAKGPAPQRLPKADKSDPYAPYNALHPAWTPGVKSFFDTPETAEGSLTVKGNNQHSFG